MSAQSDETPILDLLARMTADSLEASSLDDRTTMLVRVAALVAVDAPPASYLLNLGVAGEAGVDEEEVRSVLAVVAPIVGTAPRRRGGREHRARARLRARGRRAGGRGRGIRAIRHGWLVALDESEAASVPARGCMPLASRPR